MKYIKFSDLTEEEKKKILNSNNVTTTTNKGNNSTSLWQNIQNIAQDIGRVGNNLLLGASTGAKQSLNFAFKTGETRNRTEQQLKNQRVLGSKELNNSDKAIYLALQKSKKAQNNISEQYQLSYNKEKAEEIAKNNVLDRAIKKDEEKIQKNVEQQTNEVTKKIAELAPSIGNMAVGTAISTINPALGTAYFTTSAGGSYMQDALDRGMTRKEAVNYGAIMGLMEGATESIGIGNLSKAGKGLKTLVKGTGENIIKEGTEEIAKTSLKTVLKDYGIGIADNIMQEALIEPIQEITAGAIGGKDKTDWNDMGQRMLKSGIDGGLTSAILGGANLGIQSCIGVVEKTQNGQNVTQQELQTAVKEASKQLDVEKMITDSTKQLINKYKTSIETSQSIQNAQNTPNQQVMQMQQEKAQNTNIKQILSIKNNSIQTYEESAKKYNIDTNNETVKSIDRITRLRGINASYNADLFSSNDANAIWRTHKDNNGNITREVILNPNADTKKALQNIIVHELTHDFEGTTEYKELKDLILSYDAGNVGFEKARESLGEIYSKVYDRNSIEFQSLIDNEAVADILGNKLGTQEFIDTLTMQKPTTARKIYNWIIDKLNKLNKLTGYTNEKLFWQDVKNKFENAYRQDYKGSDIATKFDIITKGNKQYVKATRQVISGNDPLIWEQQVENYINETIRNGQDVQVLAYDGDILSITKDTAGKAKFRNEVIDKNGNKRRLNNKEFMAKLRAETHIDELAETSKHKQGPIPDTKNHSFAKDGFTYRTAYFEDIDGTYYRITMSVGKNGSINTIYNIGKMQNWQKNRRHSISELKGSSGKTTSDRISSTNSITSLSENVNTTKYSMQESENNSGSFSMLENKRFDVTGNENLNNASTLFFRTREDGIYYVQATNPAGDITYDGTFIDKRSLAKTLGKEIAEYIANNSEHTNNEIYLTSSKVENETDYMMSHRPSEEYGNGSNFEGNMNGVFEHPEWYMNIREEYNIESLNALRKVRNKPNGMITIYRATPGNKINPGDWVTPSRKYAELHNNSQLNGAGNILELKVKAKDILWGGDDINEFGYFPDVKKYSLPTKEWQQYLDENYKPTGTRTNLADIRLPIKENSEKSSFSMPTKQNTIKLPQKETNVEKYNRYKKNILDSRAKEVNNLISYKNETTRNIEKKILEKETLLNSKKDKNTKIASVLKTQIENLKTRQQRMENLYNEKIDKVNAKTNRDKINFETRNTIKKEARENLKAEISPLTEDLTKYKDKKAGILYNRETAQRNIDDIVSDKELAQAIKETIFDPIQVHQAQKTKEINRLFDKINSLDLDKTKKYDYTVETSTISGEITEAKKHIKIDEATLAQLLIENKITNQKLKDDYNMSNEQIEKINKTANTFTEILDDLYNKMNEEQIKYGYSPIGKLNNYFPHFFENKPDTMLGKIASYFGIDITKQDLPTEIAGKTDIFKPGKTWNSNTLQRKTNKTDYDALKAMQKYIQGAADIIYTTEDIQKVREYERQIRYQYSDKGIQESIDDILNNSELTQEAKDSAIEGIFKNSENELSNFVTWLNDYGNTLANKKSFADRNMERNIGRNLYSSMSGIESRIASNTIGGNLSVSLTNFAPLFQAVGTTKVNYLLTGMLQTTSNNIKGIIGKKDISFVDNSNFLTNRFGTDTIADRTVTQKMSDVASIPMNIIDEFTAESIVRGKYLENIDKGMTEEQALDSADKYASKLMADRSKGALPIIFNAKNPISKLTTMFQVEPNNIISNYLKDMPREATNKVELTKQATKLMVASYAFNTLVMAIRGGNEVLPDPIRWVSYLIKAVTGDDDEKEKAEKDLAESVIGSIPFVSNLAGFGLTDLLGIDSDIGRIPISNAMPSITNIVKAFDSEADSQYRKETIMKEFIKPFLYLGFPTGGAQIKKTFEGLSTVFAGGSYKTDKEGNKILQFPVEDPNATDYIRAGMLGKYSLPMAKEYQERNFKSLSAKQTKTYEESNLPFKEYLEYIEAGLKTNEDKINYLDAKEMNTEQKWGIYTNDIFSSTEREKDGGSQLSDAKYITSDGVSKSEYIKIYNKAQKNNIDMPTGNEYKEMKSNNISLSNYINYKIKVKNLTESKRKSKELSDTENLKNADKIQILLDSNYSNKEISAIYANYIKSEKDMEYDIMKSTGIDIKEYLKYKQQEFTSDKDDDGTLKGKTVSKSKQNKVVNYLNTMKIKGNQRLLLYAMKGYSMTSAQKTQIANYVKALDIDKETKLKLYDKFSGFTVYKDGTVKY